MKESEYKSRVVKAVRDDGGYARRLEDQFAVGLPDMLLAVRGARCVFLVEAKIVRGAFFAPSARQLVELQRINACANEHVFALLLGFDPDNSVHYFGNPADRLYRVECTSAPTCRELLDRLREI